MVTRITGTVCFLLVLSNSWAQHFQFSQYNFTDQRVNPALVAASDFAQLNFDFRNQSTGGDFNLNSTYLSGSYPLLTKKGLRWSGIGLSVMDDRSGIGGIFNTQEVSLAYAVNIYLSRYQTITLGARGLYLQQKVNVDGLFTGSQYIPDRGFDGSMSIGENLQHYRADYFTASFGLYWQQVDRWQNKLA
jgi:type IX secretion system PorP/SprF family membrane protein